VEDVRQFVGEDEGRAVPQILMQQDRVAVQRKTEERATEIPPDHRDVELAGRCVDIELAWLSGAERRDNQLDLAQQMVT
jgi:hypothetical protein